MADNGALSKETVDRVRQQVEYYFGDSNLPNDKFLLRSIEGSEDRLVSIAVICAFQKMKSHLKLSEDTTPETVPSETVVAVAEALRGSASLKVSEDGTRVGRSSTVPSSEETRADVYARCLAVSPFPWKVTREEIEKFFEDYSKAYSIRMPRHHGTGLLSGFVIIEFSTPEEAQRVSTLSLKFEGAHLKFQSRESFEAYWTSRTPAKVADYPKGLIVRFQLQDLAKDGVKKEEKDATNTQEGEADAQEKGADEESVEDDTPGLLREDIKAVFEQYGVVKYVDFSRGATSGYVRFETSEGTDKARTAAVVSEEGGLLVKNCLATLEAVQDEDEAKYWSLVYNMQNKRKEPLGGRGKGGKGGKFGKPFHKKQKRGRERDRSETTVFKGKHVRLDDGDGEDEPEAKLPRMSS